jgi:hypothetical protein
MEPKSAVCNFCGYASTDYCITTEDSKKCKYNKTPVSKKELGVIKLNSEDDFGFTFKDNKPEVQDDWENKFNKLKGMIMPLLKNLAKDPDKDIHWPDRDKKISEFIRKIQEL